MSDEKRRMSVRNIALTYGIPARAVARAIENGELPAVKLTTETGRERAYVSTTDAATWFSSLLTSESVLEKVQA